MRKLIYILSAFLLLTTGGHLNSQTGETESFKKGVDAYTAGNYSEALNQWLSVYKTGSSSPELLYNIGNAYFKLQNIPGAILFFERGLLIAPGNEDIRYNLLVAQSLTVDRFDEIPPFFLAEWFSHLSLLIHSNKWAFTSLLTFIMALVMLALWLFSSKYKIKIISFWVSVFLIFISTSTLAFSIHNKKLTADSNRAVIFTPQVSGKSSPDESGTDLFVLHEGTTVEVETKVGEWSEVRLSDGNKGWIPATAFEII